MVSIKLAYLKNRFGATAAEISLDREYFENLRDYERMARKDVEKMAELMSGGLGIQLDNARNLAFQDKVEKKLQEKGLEGKELENRTHETMNYVNTLLSQGWNIDVTPDDLDSVRKKLVPRKVDEEEKKSLGLLSSLVTATDMQFLVKYDGANFMGMTAELLNDDFTRGIEPVDWNILVAPTTIESRKGVSTVYFYKGRGNTASMRDVATELTNELVGIMDGKGFFTDEDNFLRQLDRELYEPIYEKYIPQMEAAAEEPSQPGQFELGGRKVFWELEKTEVFKFEEGLPTIVYPPAEGDTRIDVYNGLAKMIPEYGGKQFERLMEEGRSILVQSEFKNGGVGGGMEVLVFNPQTYGVVTRMVPISTLPMDKLNSEDWQTRKEMRETLDFYISNSDIRGIDPTQALGTLRTLYEEIRPSIENNELREIMRSVASFAKSQYTACRGTFGNF